MRVEHDGVPGGAVRTIRIAPAVLVDCPDAETAGRVASIGGAHTWLTDFPEGVQRSPNNPGVQDRTQWNFKVTGSHAGVTLAGESFTQDVYAWQSAGGMQLGSIWGHGGYVAPDWSADSPPPPNQASWIGLRPKWPMSA